MTKEEAKKYLIDISYAFGNMSIEYLTEKDGDKMREAIKVLEQEPCEDAVSRREVFETLGVWGTRALMELPPVTPQSKTGHWEEYGHNIGDSYIWDGVRCSVCKKDARVKTRFIKREPVIWDRDCFELTNYCPNCGAKMVESQESEVNNG